MRIIIVGCGNVGVTLARMLVGDGHSVTMVDKSPARLSNIGENIDALTVCGNGSSVAVLEEAGVKNADLLIAVTDTDEGNLLCCMIAKKAGNPDTIARVRNPIYNNEIDFIKKQLGLTMVINPEMSSAREISRVLRFPSADEIESFAGGRVELVKVQVTEAVKLDGLTIRQVDEKFKAGVLIASVERNGEVTIPGGNFQLQKGDQISVLGTPKNSMAFFKKIGLNTHQVKNAMILGGGRMSEYLAKMLLDMKVNVKIIEQDPERCAELADVVSDALIIQGNATDRDLLLAEGLESAEAFVTLMGGDEGNVILAMYAKEHSKAKLVTKISQMELGKMVGRLNLGSVIYPKYITADRILQFVRATQNSEGSNVERLYHIMDSKALALEFVVKESSALTGVPLMKLPLKNNLLIGCIIRRNEVMIPRGQDEIRVGDAVIVVTTDVELKELQDILK